MSDGAIDFDQARRSSVTHREQFASQLLNLNRVCGDEHPARPSTKKVEHGHVHLFSMGENHVLGIRRIPANAQMPTEQWKI